MATATLPSIKQTIDEYLTTVPTTQALIETISYGAEHWQCATQEAIHAKLEDGTDAIYAYIPLTISHGAADTALDTAITVSIGGISAALYTTLQSGTEVTYRAYNARYLDGPLVILRTRVVRATYGGDGIASIECATPRIDAVSVGETYNLKDQPMLAGWLDP